jgi:dihydrodipicolinate synthase/N-acetylneuraminate lyase
MQTSYVTTEDLKRSVIAVPPLARKQDGTLCREQNCKIIRHIESGGMRTLLYGGNANFYHIPLSQYVEALSIISKEAAADSLVIPSVGPAFGTMMDQLAILKVFDFPTAMVLPMQGVTTDGGVATGFRKFVEGYGKKAVLYIKFEGFLEPETVKALVNDGLVSWVKYAIVREDPAIDSYLEKLVDLVDPNLLISGIGEQPAITHLVKFKLASFTTGCGCIAPKDSMAMLRALQSGDSEEAERIRQSFKPLEDLRNAINPIRVLHDAFTVSGIANTGPALPLLENLGKEESSKVKNTLEGIV